MYPTNSIPLFFISCYQWNLSLEYRIHDSKLAALNWNALDAINEDYSIADVSTPRAQTPPSSTIEVPSGKSTGSWVIFPGISVDAQA